MPRSIDAPKQKLILVEDNTDLRQGLADYLRLCNFIVDEAASGAEFHEALRRESYEVAIIDVNLPDVSGFELAQHIAARNGAEAADTGVIVLTARGGRQDRVRGYESGADLYLTKPVDSEELALAAWNLAQRIRGTRQARAGQGGAAANGTISGEPIPNGPAEAALPPGPAAHGELPEGSSLTDDSSERGPDRGTGWRLDRVRQILLGPAGLSIPVSGKEALFLEFMAQQVGARLTRGDILRVYGEDSAPDSRKFDMMLNRLRSKARAAGMELPLQIVRGSGIRLLEPLEVI